MLRLSIVALVGVSIVACNPTFHDRLHPSAAETLQGTDPLPADVALDLSPEFVGYQYTLLIADLGADDTYIFEMGDALRTGAEQVARATFRHVTLGPPSDHVAFVLRPRAASVRMTVPRSAWDKCVTTVSLEWAISDPSGTLLWIDTVDGEARGSLGNAFRIKSNAREQLEAALGEALRNSVGHIQAATELRKRLGVVRSEH